MDSNALLVLAVIAAAVFALLYIRVRLDVDRSARQRYEQWRAAELARAVDEQKALAQREARTEFDRWRSENEAAIRQDAIDRSRSVIVGKVTEHVTPWIPAFPYNPKDARFIGSPIDMVVFDGADDDDVRRIIFLEIKTSGSGLTARQRQIRAAVQAGRVEWQELRVPTNMGALPSSSSRRLLT
jgi:predicted Holliday junction resolvase-like endonuclease